MNGLGRCLNAHNGICHQRHTVINQHSGHNTHDDRLNPTPIINDHRSNGNQNIQHRRSHICNPRKPIDQGCGDLLELGAVSNLVDLGQDRGKHGKGFIFHPGPNLRPSLGHGIELCVGFIRHSKHGVLHHFSRYLAFLCNRLDGTFRNPHILFNSSCDTRCTVQNGVQFFTTKRTRRHCLCKLDHGVALLLGRSAANNKLLVHLLHESNDLIHVTVEGVTGVQAKFRNGGSGIKVNGSGTLGGSHDLLFQHIHGTAIIHQQIQSGFGACQFIRNVQRLIDPGDTTSGNGNFLDGGQKSIGGIVTPTNGIIELLLFIIGVPDIFFNGIKGGSRFRPFFTGFPDCRRVNGSTGSLLHGFKGVQHNTHSLVHTLKGAGNTIIKGNSGSDSSHRDHHLSWRIAGALMVSAPALFAFNFLLLLLFSFHPNINGRNDEGPFTPGQSIEGGRC